jgi:hypothetical protein
MDNGFMRQEKKYFYIDGNSEEVAGPYSLEELKSFLFANRISQDTPVAEGGTKNWQNFGEVMRLAAFDEYKSAAETSKKKWIEISIILAIIGCLVPSAFYFLLGIFPAGWKLLEQYPFLNPIVNLLGIMPALFFILLYRRLKQGNEDPFSFTAN